VTSGGAFRTGEMRVNLFLGSPELLGIVMEGPKEKFGGVVLRARIREKCGRRDGGVTVWSRGSVGANTARRRQR
jgi:hypothetical protein